MIEKALTKGPGKGEGKADFSQILDVYGCLVNCPSFTAMAAVLAALIDHHKKGALVDVLRIDSARGVAELATAAVQFQAAGQVDGAADVALGVSEESQRGVVGEALRARQDVFRAVIDLVRELAQPDARFLALEIARLFEQAAPQA